MENNTREVYDLLSNSDLYELLRRKEKYSEFIDGTYKEHFQTLVNEIRELKREVQRKDTEAVQSEVMDVVYMVGQLLNKLQKDGYLEGLDFGEHKDKIMGRSPNLKAHEKVTREVENKTWHILKAKQ